MKKLVYFIRHGQSEWNAKLLYQNGIVPLSQEGITQAEFLASRFRKIPIDIIFASNMVRAHQTAEIIGKAIGKEIVPSELFREIKRPSMFVGRHETEDAEIVAIREELVARADENDWRHSDEENFADLKIRAKKALVFLEQRPEEHILVAMHGTFLKLLVALMMLGDDLRGTLFWDLNLFMRIKNTGITVCRNEGQKWELITWNDHAHLG